VCGKKEIFEAEAEAKVEVENVSTVVRLNKFNSKHGTRNTKHKTQNSKPGT
jgi:hypothetical protein